MMLDYLLDEVKDPFFGLVYFFLGIAVFGALFSCFDWIKAFIIFIIVTEIFYHIKPRTKQEKKKGRDYLDVIIYKIDAMWDAGYVTLLGAGIYRYWPKIAWDGILVALKGVIFGVGVLVGILLLIWLYLWLNKLRDTPRK